MSRGRSRWRLPSRAPALALAGSVVGFVALTTLVVAHGSAPLAVDGALHAWMLRHRTPALTAGALAVTATGSGVPTYVLAAAAGWLGSTGGRRRRARGAGLALGAVLVGQGVRLLVLFAVHRPRPPQGDWAGPASGASYPSGHATTSALVAVVVCVAVAGRLELGARRAVQCVAIVWAAAVGVTRVYLGVHWPTDVLGGWLFVAGLVAVVRWARPASADVP